MGWYSEWLKSTEEYLEEIDRDRPSGNSERISSRDYKVAVDAFEARTTPIALALLQQARENLPREILAVLEETDSNFCLNYPQGDNQPTLSPNFHLWQLVRGRYVPYGFENTWKQFVRDNLAKK